MSETENKQKVIFDIFESCHQLPPLTPEILEALKPLVRFIEKCEEHDDHTGEWIDDTLTALTGYLKGEKWESRCGYHYPCQYRDKTTPSAEQ